MWKKHSLVYMKKKKKAGRNDSYIFLFTIHENMFPLCFTLHVNMRHKNLEQKHTVNFLFKPTGRCLGGRRPGFTQFRSTAGVSAFFGCSSEGFSLPLTASTVIKYRSLSKSSPGDTWK